MQHRLKIAAIATLAALATTPALAGDHEHRREQRGEHAQRHEQRDDRRDECAEDRRHDHDGRHHGKRSAHKHAGNAAAALMQTVANAAGPADQAFGWQYFADPAARRAVVISPEGDYYLSRGKGLRWVVSTAAGV